jgi:hypothetical protein
VEAPNARRRLWIYEFESSFPSQPPRFLPGDSPRSVKRRHFRRLATRSLVSRGKLRASRTEGLESPGVSLLAEFSISEICVRRPPETGCFCAETGSNPQREDLLATEPTTLPGVVALLKYLGEPDVGHAPWRGMSSRTRRPAVVWPPPHRRDRQWRSLARTDPACRGKPAWIPEIVWLTPTVRDLQCDVFIEGSALDRIPTIIQLRRPHCPAPYAAVQPEVKPQGSPKLPNKSQ